MSMQRRAITSSLQIPTSIPFLSSPDSTISILLPTTSSFPSVISLSSLSLSISLTTETTTTGVIDTTFTTTQTEPTTSIPSPTIQTGSSSTPQTPQTTPSNSAATLLQTTQTSSLSTLSTLGTSSSSSSVSTSTSTTSSAIPTTLLQSPPLSPTQRRTILAASLSAALLLFLSLILAVIFIHRRRKKNQYDFLHALTAPVQKEHSRARLLAGEDMDDVTATANSGMGSFGPDVFGRVISVRHQNIDEIGAGSYQHITYAPPPPTTPWDSLRDPRSYMEALHHPSRIKPSEATQYMSQYLSRRAEMEIAMQAATPSTAVGSGVGEEREGGQESRHSLVNTVRSSSQVDLSQIMDNTTGANHFPPGHPQDEWSPAPSFLTYFANDTSSLASASRVGEEGEKRTRLISGTSSHMPLLPPLSPVFQPPEPPTTPQATVDMTMKLVKSSPLRRSVVLPRPAGSSDGDSTSTTNSDGPDPVANGADALGCVAGGKDTSSTVKSKNWLERSVNVNRMSSLGLSMGSTPDTSGSGQKSG